MFRFIAFAALGGLVACTESAQNELSFAFLDTVYDETTATVSALDYTDTASFIPPSGDVTYSGAGVIAIETLPDMAGSFEMVADFVGMNASGQISGIVAEDGNAIGGNLA